MHSQKRDTQSLKWLPNSKATCRSVTRTDNLFTPTTLPLVHCCRTWKGWWVIAEVTTYEKLELKVDCTLPTSLSYPGRPEDSSKTGSMWLETGLGAVDDLGLFGA